MSGITENEDPGTKEIGTMPTEAALELMNRGDARAVESAGRCVRVIASLVESVVERMRKGGRLIYVGAGTSGRLGVLDASEIPPTFGLPPGHVVGIIAGGEEALTQAVEGAEDDRSAGADALASLKLADKDTVIGLTASGNTPFTAGAIEYAAESGCLTACVTCDPEGAIVGRSEVQIVLHTGPEFIAGSTRLKAGTAQKLVLNMISTMVMVRLGYTSGNVMTNLSPANEKLRKRALSILSSELKISSGEAEDLLDASGGDLRTAIVSGRTGCDSGEARAALESSSYVIASAIELIRAKE
ncbi:MAG: N-acetylmuramic acid 6-phosphate etherase [Aridibacter famidurans]|nr:N-acetylmuramic acid 6-phosphate etherase [Aridibacter famidurans]